MLDLIPKNKVVTVNDPAPDLIDRYAAIKGLKKPEAARQLIEAGWKVLNPIPEKHDATPT